MRSVVLYSHALNVTSKNGNDQRCSKVLQLILLCLRLAQNQTVGYILRLDILMDIKGYGYYQYSCPRVLDSCAGGELDAGRCAGAPEIGRASCREREWVREVGA